MSQTKEITYKNEKQVKRKSSTEKVVAFGIGVVFITGIALVLWIVRQICGLSGLEITIEGIDSMPDIYISVLGISYSVIFLTTSLLSMLSDKNETIYWLRVNDFVLIYPLLFNYYNCSVIGYLSLAVETIAVILNRNYIFWGSFATGIIAVVILYFRMISIHFNRGKYIKKLEEVYCGNHESSVLAADFLQLQVFTLIALDEQDCYTVEENLTFMLKAAYGQPLHKDAEDKMGKRLHGFENVPANDEAKKKLYECFDRIAEKDEAQINRMITSGYAIYSNNPEACFDLEEWITADASRIHIWNEWKSVDEAAGKLPLLAQIENAIDRKRAEMPWEEGDCYDSYGPTSRWGREYEQYMMKKIGFFLDNGLWEEFEEILAMLLKRPDPVAWIANASTLRGEMHSEGGILVSILNRVYADDEKFAEYLCRYDVVAHTMAYRVDVDSEKESDFIEKIRTYYLYKDKPLPLLEQVYAEFMNENADRRNWVPYLRDCIRMQDEKPDALCSAIHRYRFNNIILYSDTWDCNEYSEEKVKEILASMQKELTFWDKIREEIHEKDALKLLEGTKKEAMVVIDLCNKTLEELQKSAIERRD